MPNYFNQNFQKIFILKIKQDHVNSFIFLNIYCFKIIISKCLNLYKIFLINLFN